MTIIGSRTSEFCRSHLLAPGLRLVEVTGGRPRLLANVPRQHILPLVRMSRRDRRTYRFLVAIWACTVIAFYVWWLRPSHVIDLPRLAFSTVLLSWVLLLPAWFLYFIGRSAHVSPDTPLPTGRVAMVVTKAPSEPWLVVRRTLEGALAQEPRHDTWLADEQPDREVIEWCIANGVSVSSRDGLGEYHLDKWPRRTKCKEGNLAYFFDAVGFHDYDVVVQLDADHVPDPGYLEAMLQPFSDPAIGYVSAPSIGDANAESSWAARARAHAEAPLHGPIQAGSFAPLCIGSHYAVRTCSLYDIGGLGPELAEDHSTTLLLQAAGWRGAHAVDAIAHGDGPESFPDLMVQEFQWSRSLTNLLLTLTPRVAKGLPWRMRTQFVFSQAFYPVFALVMLTSILAPIVALATGTPWMRVPYLTFLAFSACTAIALFAIVCWVRRRGWMRPADVPLLSWENGLFHLMRWPWVLAGAGAAIVDSLRGTAFPFKVTPKGATAAKPIPFRVVAPHLTIAAASAAAALAIGDAGAAQGYYWFAIANAILYGGGSLLVVALHRHENRDRQGRPPVRLHVVAIGLVLAIAGAACASRGDAMIEGISWTGDPEPPSSNAGAPAPGTRSDVPATVIDTSTGTVNVGVYETSEAFAESNRIAIDHHFIDWNAVAEEDLATLVKPDEALGRWPLVTLEPWPASADGTATLLNDIASGEYDEQTDEACSALASVDTPMFVRWGHEMELVSGRYPWASTDADAFTAAYRRFAERCRALMGDQLYLVWSPAGDDGLDVYYPGDDVVDYVGLSVYDYPEYLESIGMRSELSFDALFEPRYERIVDYDKPVMIAEFGTTLDGAERLAWLNDAFAATPTYPLLRSIVFFNAVDLPGVWGDDVPTPDWRIEPGLLPDD